MKGHECKNERNMLANGRKMKGSEYTLE